MKRDPKKTLRNKADKLLQMLIKLMFGKCLVCGKPISCGHHFVTKANSNPLRYYVPNIIPICKDCHCLVHSQPWKVEPIICFKLGAEWYQDLMRERLKVIKANKAWYQFNVDTLQEKIDGLGTDNPVEGHKAKTVSRAVKE